MNARSGERGAVLEEFALAGLVSLLLIFGIFEFGRALFTYDLVANGARLGTRYAIVRGSSCAVAGCPATTATIQSYVQDNSPGIEKSKLTVSTTWAASGGCIASPFQGHGCVVTVSASYPFHFAAFPYLLKDVTLTSQSKMTISQ